jgi:ankyrin repeat protein
LPLHAAPDAACALALLDARAHPSPHGADMETPLHVAAADGKDDLLQLLLARGADPVAPDAAGVVPILYAARQCQPRAVARLRAAHGVAYDDAVRAEAVERDHAPVVLLVTPEPSMRREQLFLAASLGKTRIVRTLLARRAVAHLEERDAHGDTLLHRAARGLHVDVVEFLLAAGASYYTLTGDGQRAFEIVPMRDTATWGLALKVRNLLGYREALFAMHGPRTPEGWVTYGPRR